MIKALLSKMPPDSWISTIAQLKQYCSCTRRRAESTRSNNLHMHLKIKSSIKIKKTPSHLLVILIIFNMKPKTYKRIFKLLKNRTIIQMRLITQEAQKSFQDHSRCMILVTSQSWDLMRQKRQANLEDWALRPPRRQLVSNSSLRFILTKYWTIRP